MRKMQAEFIDQQWWWCLFKVFLCVQRFWFCFTGNSMRCEFIFNWGSAAYGKKLCAELYSAVRTRGNSPKNWEIAAFEMCNLCFKLSIKACYKIMRKNFISIWKSAKNVIELLRKKFSDHKSAKINFQIWRKNAKKMCAKMHQKKFLFLTYFRQNNSQTSP